jgi:hypothetical protein
MKESGKTLNEVVNQALVTALAPQQRKRFVQRTYRLKMRVNLDKALQLAGDLEDEAILGQMRQ